MAQKDRADDAITALNKKFGPGSAYFLGDYQGDRQPTIPTGLVGLDYKLGGGIAIGKIIEIYGPEGSGKTTLALHVAKTVLRKSGIVAFVDAEHALNIDLVERMGLNISQLILSQPDCGEDGLQAAIEFAGSKAIDLVIVDSVAALTPRAEIEGEMEDQQMGLQARMMGKGIRKINAIAAKNDVAVIFINQLRMKIGVMFGNPEETPGGKPLKFFSSQRLDVRAYKHIKKGSGRGAVTIGREGKITIVKNKIAAPFKSVQTELYFGKGFSESFDLFEFGTETGMIERSGNTYSVGNVKLGIGQGNALTALKKSPKLRKKIRIRIKKALKS